MARATKNEVLDYKVKDLELAQFGRKEIDIAEREMALKTASSIALMS